LIDTAGLRRRGHVHLKPSRNSPSSKRLQAIEDANVVVLVLDASK
jgi:predicted GTPase